MKKILFLMLSFALVLIASVTTEAHRSPEIDCSMALGAGERVIQLELGGTHGAALTNDGNLYMWGVNTYGQLGYDTDPDGYNEIPTNIVSEFTLDAGETITSVVLGSQVSYALTSEGAVWSWGRNSSGQVGDGTTTDAPSPVDITLEFGLDPGETVISLYAGGATAGAITSDDKVFMWGSDSDGQLGNGSPASSVSSPVDITSQFSLGASETIISLSIGVQFSMGLSSDGEVFTWGADNTGQQGNGATTGDILTPTAITSSMTLPLGDSIVGIVAGGYHALAWSGTGYTFAWGRDAEGQVGNGSTSQADVSSPQQINSYIDYDTGELPDQIVAGERHTMLLTDDGRLLSWGRNNGGQLGVGDFLTNYEAEDITSNISMVATESLEFVVSASDTSGALTDDGFVWLWGSNISYVLTEGAEVYNEDLPILADESLTPYETFTVTFESNGGSYVANQYIADGGLAVEPTDPTKLSHSFDGWYTDDETFLNDFYFSSDTITADITLYASWTVDTWTVTFNSNGGTLVDDQFVDFGDQVIKPSNPTREGFGFVGWYADEELTDEWQFNVDTMPDESITLYAKWRPDIVDVIDDFTDDAGIGDPGKLAIALGATVLTGIVFTLIGGLGVLSLMVMMLVLVLFIALGWLPGWLAIILTVLVFVFGLQAIRSQGGGSE